MGRCGVQAEFRCAADTGVLTLAGDLDLATAAEAASALDDALHRLTDPPVLVVDLDDLLFCGARGLRVLLDAAAEADRRGGCLVLASAPPVVQRLMELIDLPCRPHPLHGPHLPPDLSAVRLLPPPTGPVLT